MKKKFTIYIEFKEVTSVGLQIFDGFFGYRQSLDPGQYLSDINIITDPALPADMRILADYMPEDQHEDYDLFDLIFLCNGGEPLQVSTPEIKKLITMDKVNLICNSRLSTQHEFYHVLNDKILWYPLNILKCRDYWNRHFYPQFFENIKNKKLARSGGLIGINGSNRTWRHHFFKLLKNKLPDLTVLSNISSGLVHTVDSLWESKEDTKFRCNVNDMYAGINLHNKDYYYNLSPKIGINDKFGVTAPGYSIMPEYFQYHCIIYPETTWQNHELCITEKSAKCFYAGSLPFPISGAKCNELYNNSGFYTCWNLLPDSLKVFDEIKDHEERYKLMIDALAWLYSNQQVFASAEFYQMTQHNLINFLNCTSDYQSIVEFDKNIMEKIKNVSRY